jgi:pilus assembly protein CpaB
MRRSRIIVLVIALAAGGIAAMLASGNRTPETPKAPEAPPPLATVDVLVAKSDLETAQVITEGDLGWQPWPAASAGSNLIRKTDRPEAIKDFVGAIVRAPVSAGEPIRDSRVVAANGRGFMATILPHNQRAFSVDIAPDTDAGGFILPNDHVDVVLTQKPTGTRQGAPDPVSKTILSNVRVLAVDQTIAEKQGQQVIVGKTATIQVDPQQAEVLANARQQGTISLALRSILDSQATTPEQPRRERPYHYVSVYFGGDGSDEKRPRVTYVCKLGRDCYHANFSNLKDLEASDGGQTESASALTSGQ